MTETTAPLSTAAPAPIAVDARAAEAFPGVEVLATTAEVTVDGLAEAADRLWLAQHAEWHEASRATIRNHPRVAAYRQLSKLIGADPDRQPPSIQALIDRGLRGKPAGAWPRINPVVDAVNAAAVTDLAALGVFDADKVTGEVRLTVSQGGEAFLALGADHTAELDPGRLILADGARVLSLFAHRDGIHQSVTTATTRVVLLGCVVPGIDAESVAASLLRAAALLSGQH
ncbi:phenylalanine--tRNA ligase beta subunit-related protein [Kitasatospora sp. NPDC002040]|uniref:phenylalanine--tRNA ligase beta subunit-related protein n=1 Tax=Kitasatospora sp. NPDC002040 TaxID=3154661 RepID=UPI00331DC4AF